MCNNTKLKNTLLEVASEATHAANSNEFASEVYTYYPRESFAGSLPSGRGTALRRAVFLLTVDCLEFHRPTVGKQVGPHCDHAVALAFSEPPRSHFRRSRCRLLIHCHSTNVPRHRLFAASPRTPSLRCNLRRAAVVVA